MRLIGKPKPKRLAICLLLPFLVGLLSAWISREGFAFYPALIKPPAAPPAAVFPIVWTLLYVLMGLSSYIISANRGEAAEHALFLYGAQLFIQFFWPVLFFGEESYLLAFLWLCLLIAFVLRMTVRFGGISRVAAYMQIPYLLWLLYAGYLNFGVFLYNRP